MNFIFEERLSDSPLVEKVWRTHSESAGSFISLAETHWEMVVTKYKGKTNITVRGPETKASLADCPPETEFFGIVFKVGTFMPHLPARKLRDRNDANLPIAANKSFWLNSSTWQFPSYENTDTFIKRLMREGLLVRDGVVEAALHGQLKDLSSRSLQRRFLHVTGLTQVSIRQIERARHAMTLLQQGVPILDTVHETGYFDQSHLTKSLKHFVGQTPAQIASVIQPK